MRPFFPGARLMRGRLAFALINFGSALATVTVGRLTDKAKNPYPDLQGGFVLGFLSLVTFGRFATSPFLVIASMSVLCGFFIAGTVSGLVALVTLSYSNDLTGSALGWA